MRTATDSIILIDTEGRHQIAAPNGFDWKKFPGVVIRDGKSYGYIGTIDGTPHYKAGEIE